MRRCLLVSVAAFALGTVLVAQLAGPAGQAQPATGGEHSFDRKVVVVTIKNGKAEVVLVAPQIKQLGGRRFLMGTSPGDDLRGRHRGKPDSLVWFPVDEVAELLEFSSLDDVKRYYSIAIK